MPSTASHPRLSSGALLLAFAALQCAALLPPSERTALLLKVHRVTPGFLARLEGLSRELSEARSLCNSDASCLVPELHVQYYSAADVSRSRISQEEALPPPPPFETWHDAPTSLALQRLSLALGGMSSASLTVLTHTKLSLLWGEAVAEFHHKRRTDLSSSAEVAFHSLYTLSHDTPPYTALWVLEPDVAWTGSLLSTLACADAAARRSGAHTGDAGLICWRLIEVGEPWVHYKLHSRDWLNEGAPSPACQMFLARYGASLLEEMGRRITRGEYAHVEVFARAVCDGVAGCNTTHLGNVMPPQAVGDPFRCCGKGILNESAWSSVVAAGSTLSDADALEAGTTRSDSCALPYGRVYHPVKF